MGHKGLVSELIYSLGGLWFPQDMRKLLPKLDGEILRLLHDTIEEELGQDLDKELTDLITEQ